MTLLAAACGGQEEGGGAGGSSAEDGGAAGIGGGQESGGSASVGGSGMGNAPGSGGGGAPGAGGEGGSPAGGAASGGALSGGAGGDVAGSGGDIGAGGDVSAGACPLDPPMEGLDCSELNLSCSYGDDPRWECRTSAVCVPFSLSSSRLIWNLTLPPDSCDAPPLPDECPTSPATGDCTTPPDQCVYEDGTVCLCTDCEPNTPVCGPVGDPSWSCSSPPAGCPAVPPNEGTACMEPNETVCEYRCDRRVVCVDGLWVRGSALCPVCAAPDTGIETPSGLRPIAEIQVGDFVFSMVEGVRTAVPVLKTGRAPQVGHFVAKITLRSGAILFISGGHPTADGRTLNDLSLGDSLGAAEVAALELVPYPHSFTYDILPDSPDGSYFAEGALIGSTLFVPRVPAKERLSER